MTRGRAIVAMLACVLALVPGPARPADPGDGTLSPGSPPVTWTGHFTAAVQSGVTVTNSPLGDPMGCVNPVTHVPFDPPITSGPAACDAFALTVEADPSFWKKNPGGVEVTVDDFAPADIDLAVYEREPDGSVGAFVDDSEHGGGRAETVLIPEASGDYYAIAIGYAVINTDYTGSASFVATKTSYGGAGRAFDPTPLSKALYGIQAPDLDPERQRHVVEGADGAHLYVETWLPVPKDGHAPPAKIPTILVMTPYVSQGVEEYSDAIDFFVSRGYALAQHHVRGTGESGGCLEQTGPNQIDDGARVVEYLGRDAPWTDGTVGMYGISYDAETQISVAGLGDPERTKYLKAIIPASSVGGQYEYSFFDGVPYLAFALASNAGYLAISAIPGQTVNTQYAQKLDCQTEVLSSSADQSGDVTPFWQEREYRAGAPKIRAATLMVHGLSDFNVLPLTEAGFFDRLSPDVPHKGLFGIWEHAFPDSHSTRPEWARSDWFPMALAWYDRYLKGLPTGVESWPPVQVQGTDGQWRGEPNWPSTGGPVGQLALGPGGVLGTTKPSGETIYSEGAGLVAGDLPTESQQVVFETGPLKERLEITGQPVLDVWVSLDQPDAHFVAELETFDAAGDRIEAGIDWGMRSARHLDPIVDNHFAQAEGKPAPTSTPIRVEIRFLPTNLVIPKGGSLRLTVSGLLTLERGIISGTPIGGSTPSGAMTTVTILHDCEHPSALRFLMARPTPDLIKVRDARPPDAPKPATTAPVSDAGGLARAAVCGKSPVRLGTFGPARAYAAPAAASKAPTPKPAPEKPKVLGRKTLPATGTGSYAGAAFALLAASLLSARVRRVRRHSL